MAQLPAAPSSARVALWRRLRAAGAASVLNGAWVLPVADGHQALFAQLAEMARGQGGAATVFTTTATAPEEEDAIVARFQADRAREYDEFAERTGNFLAEVERETQLRKFTFAELEEIEDDLEKLTAWLGKIKARDFFPNTRAQEASDTLEACGTAQRAFAGAVYAQENIATSPDDNADPLGTDNADSPLKGA
ncbi:MAG: hypothetical protein BGN99_25045 [Alphaproteobacteria bacterium 65-37]|nr:MAG: hypothetical protein BGN99_25045 [Alphaproteobacteria bacterium 65-37]